jgi:adenosine/AMP kinase
VYSHSAVPADLLYKVISMLQYSSYVHFMIFQLQLTPAVCCVFCASNNALCVTVTNTGTRKHVIPFGDNTG